MMPTEQWLETIESLFTDIIRTWDGLLILMGDTNIDLMKVSDSVTKSYNDIHQSCNLQQHITKPTRITQSSKTLIDHVIPNKPRCVSYSDVLPYPSVSNHDAPYVRLNVRISRFQPGYKIIRNEKDVDMVAYYNDFSSIPFSVVYAFSDPEEMLASFNTLIKDCINRHAPIKRVKVTRPPCPWLKTSDIQALQVKRNKLRFEAHKTSDDSVWNAFREVRNTLKTKNKSVKRRFFQTALSSRNSKKIWKVIHSILIKP